MANILKKFFSSLFRDNNGEGLQPFDKYTISIKVDNIRKKLIKYFDIEVEFDEYTYDIIKISKENFKILAPKVEQLFKDNLLKVFKIG